MELDLKKTCFDTYEAGAEVTLTQEETAETIVPDYCPDIARIIDAEGKIFLHSRELRDGRAEVSGTVRVTVLYTPDGESGMRTLDFAMPFSAITDIGAMPDCTCLCADTEMEFLESRILNPRKIFTHCKLVTRMTGYRLVPMRFCSDLEADESYSIEKRQESQQASILTHFLEKDFTFSDEMNLSPGKAGAAEILTHRISASVMETKVVGNKLILKGVFTICLLYRAVDGPCQSATGELPFSQILEVEGATEGSRSNVQLQLTGTDIQVGDSSSDDGRRIAVTLYWHVVAMMRESRTFTLLCDAYSTAYDLTYDAKPLTLTNMAETIVRRQAVREMLETGVVADSILSMSVCCGAVSVSREGENVTLRTGATVRALYLDEGGVPLMVERCIDVVSQLELPETCQVLAKAVCTEEIQGNLSTSGIEVRFTVEFRINAVSKQKKVYLTSVNIDSDKPKDFTGYPSLVLRSLGVKETLWELAKHYHTTVPIILEANELEEESDVPRNTLLLIPRRRT